MNKKPNKISSKQALERRLFKPVKQLPELSPEKERYLQRLIMFSNQAKDKELVIGGKISF